MPRAFLVLLLLAAAGCASVKVAPVYAPERLSAGDSTALATAHSEFMRGCYECLVSARDTYARLVLGPARPDALTRLFETEILLVFRAKELSIAWDTARERAAALLPELPDSLDGARLLRLADEAMFDAAGLPSEDVARIRERRATFSATVNNEVAWLSSAQFSDELRDYVTLSLRCSYPSLTPAAAPASAAASAPAAVEQVEMSPLVGFRAAICGLPDATALSILLATEPRFVEARLFMAAVELPDASENGGKVASQHLDAAYTQFPRSLLATTMLGTLHRDIGECESAIRYFDEAVALRPEHSSALLGKTMCLTELKRAEDAIATATRILDIPLAERQPALYWRALNQHALGRLTEAQSDIDAARQPRRDSDVLTLAGIIEFDREDLVAAERDLRAALAMPQGRQNCTASMYLGRVQQATDSWADAATRFESTMACYDAAMQAVDQKIGEITADPEVDGAYKLRKTAQLRDTRKRHSKMYHASAFNAAANMARSDNYPRARQLLDVASGDPELLQVVSVLRDIIR